MITKVSPVYLVSCVSKKQAIPSPAQDLYVSAWFKKARRYAEASSDQWLILSAEYGLVKPDRVIAPYERTLNKMPINERRAWAEQVAQQLADIAPELKQVVFLAGSKYREFLEKHLTDHDIEIFIPMENLPIGKQLQWLDRNLP